MPCPGCPSLGCSSPGHTVQIPITNILNKLDLNSRTQISRWMAGLNGPGLIAAEEQSQSISNFLREPRPDVGGNLRKSAELTDRRVKSGHKEAAPDSAESAGIPGASGRRPIPGAHLP
jgi:hypothetical protein